MSMIPIFQYNTDYKNVYEQEVAKWLIEDGVLTEEPEAFMFYDGFDVDVYVDGDKDYNSQQPRANGFLDKKNPYYAGYPEDGCLNGFEDYEYSEPNHYAVAICSKLESECGFDFVKLDTELNEKTSQKCYLYVTKRMTEYNYGKELYGYIVVAKDTKEFVISIVVGKHYAHDTDTAMFLVRTVYNELISQYKADFNDSGTMTDVYQRIEAITEIPPYEGGGQCENGNILQEAIRSYGDKQKESHQGLINSGRIEFMINRKEVDMEEMPF